MKLIIAGSRTLSPDPKSIYECIYYLHKVPFLIDEIISGGAKGVDTYANYFAKEYDLQFKEFPADWEKYGKSAGYIRNKQMAEYADALFLIWDGESKGSGNMKETMLKLNKPVYEVIIRSSNVCR
jgi:YspA, cpYpsA-related SLOG family